MDVPVKYTAPLPQPAPAGDATWSAGDLSPVQSALRHKYAIVAFAVAVAVAAAFTVENIRSVYTSEAEVAFDVQQLSIMGDSGPFHSEDLSSDVMATEVAVLNSPVIANKVVEQLGLQNLAEFKDCTTKGTLVEKLRALVGLGTVTTACVADPDFAAHKLLGDVMSFSNDDHAYIVTLAAKTHDPDLSARIANSYADAYLQWRLTNHDQRAAEADRWLSSYLDGLHTKTVAANDAVATYRIQHHLISPGPSVPGGSGETVVGQTLTQLNAQLTDTDSDLAAREAVLSETHGAAGALGTATALSSPVVQSMLERRAEAAANLATLRARYGDEHPKVISAAAELSRIDAQLSTETSRSVTSLQGEVRALQGRRTALERQVQQLEGAVSGENQSDVRLDELQRDADTENSLYRSMLERMKQIDADRHTQISDASIAVPAEPDYTPTAPHRAMLVAGAFLASLGIGAGAALARELTAPRFRDIKQLENETGLPVLGAFAAPPRGVTPRDLVFERPFSPEVEMLNAILARIENESDRSAGGRTMLITSALPNEGKSSFGVAIGRLAAQAGLRTLLIDGDLRRSSLQSLISGGEKSHGGGEVARIDGITTDGRSGLALLSLRSVVGDARRIVAARGIGEFVAELRTRYDLILIDTPPVLAVPDTGSLAAFADDIVMMVDWTRASREAVNAAVDELRRIRAHLAGLVVTKVGLRDYARIASSPVHDIRRYREYMPRVAG